MGRRAPPPRICLASLGLNVVVIERDPDVYGRARAISTDEEVMRIWQSVGLADRLQRDMLPDRPLAWVDANGCRSSKPP